MEQPNDTKIVNERRRALLKLAFFGSAAFVVAKVVEPTLNLFSSSTTTNHKNFRVVDGDTKLYVYDKQGNELLVVEKDSDSASGGA